MLAKSYAEKLQFLITRRFPDAWKLEGKDTNDPRADELQRYKSKLAGMTDHALDEQYIEAVDEQTREKEEAEERDDRLRFFSQPDAAADFRFWCSLNSWTLEEAAALLLGKDPRKVFPHSLHHLSSVSPFARLFEKLRSQLRRAANDGRIKDRDPPRRLVEWAAHAGIAIPPQLSSALDASITDDLPAIEGRERASMLKLILGMAKKRYGYDPAARSGAPKEIADDLASLGITLNPETVRKYLQEAASLQATNTIKKEL